MNRSQEVQRISRRLRYPKPGKQPRKRRQVALEALTAIQPVSASVKSCVRDPLEFSSGDNSELLNRPMEPIISANGRQHPFRH